MENRGFIAFVTALILSFLTVENGAAQSKILVKAGPTFAFSSENNYWGGGAGLEKQIGRKWSFSFTFEYLKTTAPDSTTFKKDILKYTYSRNTFNQSVLSVNPEFRFYPKRNPLASLEGFFIGLGLEIGQLETTQFNIQYVWAGNTQIPILKSVIHGKDLVLMPHFSLGSVFHLNENLSLELSGGIKAGSSQKTYSDITVMPIIAKIRYAF
jgi:hypothetical protein